VHKVKEIGISHLDDYIDITRRARFVSRDRSEYANPRYTILESESVLAAANRVDD
jgi:hypothetical protein